MRNNDATPEPWECQAGESAKAFAAFCVYRDLPPDMRSCSSAWEAFSGQKAHRTSRSKGPRAPRVWAGWSAQYGWVARAAAWDREQDRIVRAKLAKAAAEAKQRRLTEAQWLHVNGINKLRELAAAGEAIPAALALRMVEVGQNAERLESGDVTQRAEVSGPDGGPLVVSVAQLGAMVRHAKQDDERRVE